MRWLSQTCDNVCWFLPIFSRGQGHSKLSSIQIPSKHAFLFCARIELLEPFTYLFLLSIVVEFLFFHPFHSPNHETWIVAYVSQSCLFSSSKLALRLNIWAAHAFYVGECVIFSQNRPIKDMCWVSFIFWLKFALVYHSQCQSVKSDYNW